MHYFEFQNTKRKENLAILFSNRGDSLRVGPNTELTGRLAARVVPRVLVVTLRIVVVRSAARRAVFPTARAALATAGRTLAALAALAAAGIVLTAARRRAATRRVARRVIGVLIVTFGIVAARFAATILTTFVTFVFGIVGLSHNATINLKHFFATHAPNGFAARHSARGTRADDASCDPFKQNTYHNSLKRGFTQPL